jgi:hypothetical protein
VRKSSVRASKMVVTGTVMRQEDDDQPGVQSQFVVLRREEQDGLASATHQDERLKARAGGCMRWKEAFETQHPHGLPRA